jgi:hypothetical protein
MTRLTSTGQALTWALYDRGVSAIVSPAPMTADDKTALLIIDAQQEYFAPSGKVVLPGGPPAVKQIARVLAWARGRFPGARPCKSTPRRSRRPVSPSSPNICRARSPARRWREPSTNGESSGSSSPAS